MNPIILGSGLSGLVTAYKLTQQNIVPTILTSGFTESTNPNLMSDLKKFPKAWKSVNGSYHPFQKPKYSKTSETFSKVAIQQSYGKYGFSEVWGATVFPIDNDMKQRWKTLGISLDKQYNELFKLIPMVFEDDSLSKRFQIPQTSNDLSSFQISSFLDELAAESNILDDGLLIGKSRLAIKSKNKSIGCTLDGTCLTGCKNNHIFSSANLIALLGDKINLVSDIEVVSFEEYGPEGLVKIRCRNIVSDQELDFLTERVFVALGPLGTSKLILNSVEDISEIRISDSNTFYLPLWHFKSHNFSSNVISLSNLVISFFKNNRSLFLQLYPNTLDLLNFIKKKLNLTLIPDNFIKFFMKHFTVSIGFIPSTFSDSISVKKVAKNNFFISRLKNEGKRSFCNSALKDLGKQLIKIRVFRIPGMILHQMPGAGVHSGSLINPDSSSFINRINGRLEGHSNIIIVDSSSLPEIPVGSISLTSMANAMRIVELNL